MDYRPLDCPQCREPLPHEAINTGTLVACPTCGAETQVEIFPAFYRPIAGDTPETILVEGEASCYYHPEKRAVLPCGGCGRFLCALCDVQLGDQHLCPACLQTHQQKGKLTELENRRPLYGGAALSLALLPILIWPFTFITAPTAIGLAVYSFRRPGSLVRRSRLQAWLAIIIGVLQLVVWSYFLFAVFLRHQG